MGKNRRKKVRRPGQANRWSLAVINCGKGPNQEIIAEYHSRTHSLRSTDPIPPTLGLTLARSDVPRAAVIQKLMIGDLRHHRLHTFQRLLKQEKAFYKVWLYFSGRQFIFVRESTIHPFKARQSVVYPSKERAEFVLKRDRIIWTDREIDLSPNT